MNQAFLIQTLISAVAVLAMIGIAAWARIPRPLGPLDEATAKALFAEEFPDRSVETLWISADAAGALAKSGAWALVLSRTGDGYVARQLAWADALRGRFKDGRLTLALNDVGAPRAVLALAAWPPEGAGAC